MGKRYAARRVLLVLIGTGLLMPVFAAPVSIMVEDQAAPWSDATGKGAANDLVRQAFAARGIEVQLQVVPYARCKRAVEVGEVAACFNMSWESTMSGKVKFAAEPLFSVIPQFYQNVHKPLRAHHERELAVGVVVGIVNGYEYPASFAQLAARGVKFEAAASELVNFKKLQFERVDAMVFMGDDLKQAKPLLAQLAHPAEVVCAFQGKPQGSYIGFSLKHPEGRRLLAEFNRGYSLIRQNGVAKAIMQRWAGGQAPQNDCPL